MPKLKSHSGAKKRFSFTGTGKLSYRRVGRGHHLTVKGPARLRKLRKTGYVDATRIESLKKLLPYN
ncbi:MAG TPA: 50S ribosomal protein L35 [Synergistales bacterium]|jgi:large subunit ribosomal protein L35|nr:50S ribosomal protein L35 [Synergistaceae bacterium]NLD95665.1 50S ribosomal protein L35 [Synergistaceae bacterium]HOO86981.1 50S ribosomal protein L35 [Synergistales bacterium]HPE66828.1 50S ribosomal protein L35 [Synergistales bacterium]HRV98134.1 50S ribosomal protein L35 [Aminobacteriaceae bacterium]